MKLKEQNKQEVEDGWYIVQESSSGIDGKVHHREYKVKMPPDDVIYIPTVFGPVGEDLYKNVKIETNQPNGTVYVHPCDEYTSPPISNFFPKSKMWEYTTVKVCNSRKIQSTLNKMGEVGWEVCSTIPHLDNILFVLKREK
jgi:hypothetical protein